MTITPWPASWLPDHADVHDIAAFLIARLDEDERVARDAHYEGQRWLSEEEDVCRWPDDELVHIADRKRDARHIARWEPARVLAEVETKRAIVMRYRLMMDFEPGEHRSAESIRTEQLVLAEMIRRHAAVYADHADYLDEWRRA